MNELRSYTEYCEIVKQAKKVRKSTTTNCLMSEEEMTRLSDQHRVYFEECDGGILIYVDEISHFLLFYYWNPDFFMTIEPKNKAIVSRTVYSEQKKDSQKKIDQMLLQNNFKKGDVLRLAIKTGITEGNKKIALAKRVFDGSGLKIVNAAEEYIQEIRELMDIDDAMHRYEIPYLTDQEIVESGQKGRFVCVVDGNNKVVGFRGSSTENTSNGYMRIRDEYKVHFGIAMVLLDYSDTYSDEHGLKNISWIEEQNISSVRLHLDMGREWGNRYMEYMILDERL